MNNSNISLPAKYHKLSIQHKSENFIDVQFWKSFPQYQYIAVAGTFDHLHGGHKRLLSLAAISATEEVVIGVLSTKLQKNIKFTDI